tara:strand:+ start:9794 stop:10072 length:279 start_codon:yes stop_codon:yes gene_type:complete
MNLYSLSNYKVNILIKHKSVLETCYGGSAVLQLKYNTSKFKHPIAFLVISIILSLISTSPYPNTAILKQHQSLADSACLSQIPSFFKKVTQL